MAKDFFKSTDAFAQASVAREDREAVSFLRMDKHARSQWLRQRRGKLQAQANEIGRMLGSDPRPVGIRRFSSLDEKNAYDRHWESMLLLQHLKRNDEGWPLLGIQ